MAEKRRNVGGNLRLTSKRAKLLQNGKVTQEEEEDRLSALPDSLLLHILSFLRFRLKEISRTCVLSKRWQFLWLDLSEFYFCEERGGFVDWVDKTLSICSGIHLKMFRVSFMYKECFASSVNSWLQFVIENKVKSVDLDFSTRDNKNELYKLPQMMYSNSSLTHLGLRRCIIAPLMVEWKSLKKLFIHDVELNGSLMGIILLGCPVLESLILGECWGTNFLEIDSRSLREVMIITWKGERLEIFAPFLQSLTIYDSNCWEFRLTCISPSLVKAKLRYGTNDINLYRSDEASSTQKLMDCMKQLFGNLRHVEELCLSSWFIEVLSALEVKSGWRLPQYSCKHLTVQAFRHSRRSIPTILSILESSPNLETLVINGCCSEATNVTPDPVASSYLRKCDDWKCDLLHLKNVNISGCTTGVVGGELLKLVQVLLKRAKVLEKMEIDVEVSSTCGIYNNFNIPRYLVNVKDKILQAIATKKDKILQALLSYPRSSTKAVVILT